MKFSLRTCSDMELKRQTRHVWNTNEAMFGTLCRVLYKEYRAQVEKSICFYEKKSGGD